MYGPILAPQLSQTLPEGNLWTLQFLPTALLLPQGIDEGFPETRRVLSIPAPQFPCPYSGPFSFSERSLLAPSGHHFWVMKEESIGPFLCRMLAWNITSSEVNPSTDNQ